MGFKGVSNIFLKKLLFFKPYREDFFKFVGKSFKND